MERETEGARLEERGGERDEGREHTRVVGRNEGGQRACLFADECIHKLCSLSVHFQEALVCHGTGEKNAREKAFEQKKRTVAFSKL